MVGAKKKKMRAVKTLKYIKQFFKIRRFMEDINAIVSYHTNFLNFNKFIFHLLNRKFQDF